MSLLTVEQFRRAIGYNPFHFWGLSNQYVPVTSSCNQLVKKYAWQGVDAAGREDILQAIEAAEAKIIEYLGYAPMPRYVVETIPYPKYYDDKNWRTGSAAADGRRAGVFTSEGKVRAVGVETRTLIATANITYSDADGDNVEDTFTISAATAVTDANEIAVYFSTADRFNDATLSENWRIRPVKVTISGGTVTVVGPKWLLVKPVKYEGVDPQGLDPNTASNFVTTLDIYRRYTKTDGVTTDDAQATLLWETLPCVGWWCCNNVASTPPSDATMYDPAAVGMSVARVGIRDSEIGIVTPATSLYNATAGTWSEFSYGWREPDRVTLRYYAGEQLENGDMKRSWQIVIARMACAELASRICACNEANKEIHQWQFDLARAAGANDEQYTIAARDLDNPFGTRRGQVYAFREVSRLRLGRATLV